MVAAVATTSLASCSPNQIEMGDGTSSSGPSAAASAFNDQDVMFAQMMIPHHEQAVEMADQILGKSSIDPGVVDLAERIKAAQGPEIELMKTWLRNWGASMPGMSSMDHGSEGMMSESDMAALDAATGAEAGRLFLEGMITHHQGAIDMAKFELKAGENPDALALAQSIVAGQSAEIAEMEKLLASF